MTAAPNPGTPGRLLVLGSLTLGFALLLFLRLGYWQIVRRPELIELGQLEYYRERTIPAQRGSILDRHETLLAGDIYAYEVFATPRDVPSPEWTAQQLAPLLGQPAGRLWELLREEALGITLAKGVPLAVGDQLQELSLPGIGVSPLPQRVYPQGPLAAHLLGFVGADGQAFYGLEEAYNSLLLGRPGSRGGERDPAGAAVPVVYGSFVPAADGPSLVVSLDASIQALVEEELRRGLRESGAESGTIIVMDPRNGQILAMASQPAYDPNRYFETQPHELFANPAISQVYEPGSVFKVVTMAAALDSGLVTPESTYVDNGLIMVGGRPIYNWNRAAYGQVNMTQLLAQSLNVGAATLSTRMGPETFYKYVQAFGFGETSGIDLAGEIPGLLKLPGDPSWHESDLGTNAFGQGIGVTPLQMITAVASIANGGQLVTPQLGLQLVTPTGPHPIEPQMPRRQVIKPDTARTLAHMLEEGIRGETVLAQVPGYSLAGKTGTAQIPIPGGYDPIWTIASFIGFGPREDPQFIILVKLDRPSVAPWGSVVAAPVFSRIAQQLFSYLGIPPDDFNLVDR